MKYSLFTDINTNSNNQTQPVKPIFKYSKKNAILFYNVKSKIGEINCKNKIKSVISQINKKNVYFFKKRTLKPALITINNTLKSISNGYSIELLLVGLGFKITRLKKNQFLFFELHYSHKLIYKIPKDVAIRCAKKKLLIFGLTKARVLDVAEEIKALRFPNTYKGKGIKFANEIIKLKPGKQR